MKKRVNSKVLEIPTTSQLEKELNREKYKSNYKTIFNSTIYVLIVVVATAVIGATLLFPVLQIYGKSMQPTLVEDNIVVCIKKKNFETGDVIAFYYNNKILVKRVIASSADWVKIDETGNVFVNDKLLNEPYVKEKALGEGDITYPYQVPEDSYFVMGDDRVISIDSRDSSIGTISSDNIIGKVFFKVWPIKNFGVVK